MPELWQAHTARLCILPVHYGRVEGATGQWTNTQVEGGTMECVQEDTLCSRRHGCPSAEAE
jgi:hypothetical protein